MKIDRKAIERVEKVIRKDSEKSREKKSMKLQRDNME